MDKGTRYSAGYVMSDASMKEAILGFEVYWLIQFWFPSSVVTTTDEGKLTKHLSTRSVQTTVWKEILRYTCTSKLA